MKKKLTKGQKNELSRQAFQERKTAIEKHGYSIKSRKLGYGETSVSLWKDGLCLHPGQSYEYEFQVVDIAEKLINKII